MTLSLGGEQVHYCFVHGKSTFKLQHSVLTIVHDSDERQSGWLFTASKSTFFHTQMQSRKRHLGLDCDARDTTKAFGA